MQLSERMKDYENVSRRSLLKGVPVIIRIDGKAFHTFTKNFDKPFDGGLVYAMAYTTKCVMEKIQGCKMAYTQSDEASFLLTDYDSVETQGWFGYTQSKIESVAASMFTAFFNNEMQYLDKPLAFFDARAFNVPKEDVVNYFLWRANDWHRNSLSMLARAHFSAKELHGKDMFNMHEMLYKEKGINWETHLTPQEKNGTFMKYRIYGDHKRIEPSYDIENGYGSIHDYMRDFVNERSN